MQPDNALHARRARLERNNRAKAATIAYNYPQYTLKEAANLPYGDQQLLLIQVEIERMRYSLDMLSVTAAATSKKSYDRVRSKLKSSIKRLEANL